MFEDWKDGACEYVLLHLDRKPFWPLADKLPETVRELADLHLDELLALGVIDEKGDSTGADYDEDDLLEAILTRYVTAHACNAERELLVAALLDQYLTLSDEYNEEE